MKSFPDFTIEQRRDLKARILTRVKFTENSCWEWQLHRNKKGYGVVYFNSTGFLSHRTTFCLWKSDPKELCVLHKCDNPRCCNPHHLFLGTDKDNAEDKKNKGRSADQKGEKNPRHKLTQPQVLEILSIRGKIGYEEIGKIYGISIHQVKGICYRKAWKHLENI